MLERRKVIRTREYLSITHKNTYGLAPIHTIRFSKNLLNGSGLYSPNGRYDLHVNLDNHVHPVITRPSIH